MDAREKLVELIRNAHKRCKAKKTCQECEQYGNGSDCVYMFMADELIAHGVTVQEWISVKDGLPENDYGTHWKARPHYLVYLANGLMMVATFGFKEYAWWIDSHSCVLSKEHYKEVTHWMPLPQPPKGE